MGLPAGYQRLAYLIGNNSAYSIISGLHLTDADEVRAEVYITGNCNVYGCYTGSSAGDNFSLYVGSTYYARMDGKVVSNVSSAKNARLALVHNKDGVWINGTKRITFTDVGEFTASTDFYVGWLDNASSAKVIGRIYRLEVVGKFVGIPALRVSDGVCGIYDTLNGTFYASNGTAWAGVLADETERSLLARRRLMISRIPKVVPAPTKYDFTPVANTYINNTNGAEVSYSGWSSTPYIPINGHSIVVALVGGRPSRMTYYYFYGAAKESLGQGTWNGYAYVPPAGAKYVRFSNGSTATAQMVIIGTSPDNVLTPPVEVPNAYIANGVDVSYNGWNIYRVDNAGWLGVACTNQAADAYNAFYDANGYMSMFSTYAQIPGGCTYLRFSNNASPCYVFPVTQEQTI